MDINNEIMSDQNNTALHLEPRVARLETSMEALTRNVGDLTLALRENSTSTNQKIDSLVVAVTQAQAPKKTDWSLFISIGFFILALGGAIFYPLNKSVQENKEALTIAIQKLESHTSLDSHPVSAKLISQLDVDLHNHIKLNERELKEHDEADAREFANLDKKLQTEYQLVNTTMTTKIANLDEKYSIELKSFDDQIQKRFAKLENARLWEDQQDLMELRTWRIRAMNGELKTAPPVSISPVGPPPTK